MPRKFHLGHFILERHIEKSICLLKYQLLQQSPLYNNLDYTIYRNEDIDNIDPSRYYNEYIKRDSMYYFEDLFYAKKYFRVQRAYKIREYHFLSLHAQIIYYAFGFYIRELLDKRVAHEQELYQGKNINVYYGGKLNFDQPKNSKIFYYEDYKNFLMHKEQLTNPEDDKHTFAISLDIKSFFYTINHKILLDIIDKSCTPVLKQSLNFDEETKSAILTFLNYFQGLQFGLPVANQNIISSFLSSIYFSSFDQYIIDNYLNTTKYNYIRYVDDFYLIFKEDSGVNTKDIRKSIYDIENDFAAFLINELELSISTSKSERYEIKDVESQINFLKSSSLDSPFDQEFDFEDLYKDSVMSLDIQGKKVSDIFQECIAIIEKLKAKTSKLSQLDLDIKESAYLNHILILKSCLAFTRSPDAIEMVKTSRIFEDLDSIDYLLIKPKVFFHLITVTKENRVSLFQFIILNLQTFESLLQKLTLVDKFVHQMIFMVSEAKGVEKASLITEYNDYKIQLINRLIEIKIVFKANSYLDLILNSLIPNHIKIEFTKIYNTGFLNLDTSISLAQQIKLRRLNEIGHNYSVCFNHLLNEFQNLFELTYFDSTQQTAKEITKKNGRR
jgi:hypothetical protein